MPKSPTDRLLELLACPTCAGALERQKAGLACASCQRRFPVLEGIPRFVTSDEHAASFAFQWNRYRSEQLDSATGLELSRSRLLNETGWSPEWLADKVVLDAGCGAGRFTEVLAEHATHVVAVDISSAVEAVRQTTYSWDNVDVVQADLTALPFKPGVFDGVVCIGVIQHTPCPTKTLGGLPHPLRPGGRLAVTIYERKPWTKLNSKYLVRPLTRRLPPARLARALELAMPLLFPLTEVLFRIPVVKRLFRFLVPVANYVGQLPLTRAQRYRWALLDTFDMLSPRYDQPLTEAEAHRVLESALTGLRRRPHAGLTLVGERRAARAARVGI